MSTALTAPDFRLDVARVARSPKTWLGLGGLVAFVLGLPMVLGMVVSLFEMPRYLRLKMK